MKNTTAYAIKAEMCFLKSFSGREAFECKVLMLLWLQSIDSVTVFVGTTYKQQKLFQQKKCKILTNLWKVLAKCNSA